MTSIAFIGVGRMGSGMAGRLIDAGHDVRVFDPSPDAVAAMVGRGATAASSPAEAADGATFALLSLPNAAIVRAAVFNDDGITSAANRPQFVLDFSTIDVASAREFARALEALGITYLDTPVSGGTAGAANGQLVLMVGASEPALVAVSPVLELLASRIVRCGDVGAGQLTKLSHNMLTAINTVAAGEILTAAVAAGGDLEILTEVFTAGLAGSKMLAHFDKTLFTEERPGLFALDLMHKDIALFADAFPEAVLPLSQQTIQTYKAARREGLGARDSSSVVELYERLYDLQLTATKGDSE